MTGSPDPKPLLRTLAGEKLTVPPLWLMRQAGRYLPEYRALRAEKGGFLDLVNDPAAATEVTLQPLRRFAFDGAILFSDILMVPNALGQRLWFEAGEGPRLAPELRTRAAIEALRPDMAILDPVYATVRGVAAALPAQTTFLGFAGSPWTVATYMIAGKGSREQAEARRMAYGDPAAVQELIDRIVAVTIDYLAGQVAAGVEAVQLFDSWSGSLAPAEFERWVIAPTVAIVEGLRARVRVPIIGFPKGAGGKLAAYARETTVDAIGLDETVDPVWADAQLPTGLPVQGNLDPLLLIAGGEALDAGVDRVLAAFADRPHVFNLGHGIQQDTPIAHVERLVARVRGA